MEKTNHAQGGGGLGRVRCGFEVNSFTEQAGLTGLTFNEQARLRGLTFNEQAILRGLYFNKHSLLLIEYTSSSSDVIRSVLQIEAGHMEIEDSVEFDIRFEVNELLNSFAEQARQRGLELNGLVQDSVPGHLIGDPNRLRQVLNNLLSNAMKFTKAGGILLCVQVGNCAGLEETEGSITDSDAGFLDGPSDRPLVRWINFNKLETPSMQPGVVSSAKDVLRMREASRHNFQQSVILESSKLRLVVSCSDTGIGIVPSAQLRLFTPFLQADAATSRKYGGTGIGLSICQKLIHLMGGEVSVATREGVGSTFQFDVALGFRKPEKEAKELHRLRSVVVER
jgi:signal transduction histidine kinase